MLEFTSAADLRAHYKSLRNKFYSAPKPEPKPEPVIIPIEVIEPVEEVIPIIVMPPPDTEPVLEVKTVLVAHIVRTACNYFGLSVLEILSERRDRRIVRPRQIAMYLAREMTLKGYPEIGRRIGGRDHTTVLHACRKVVSLMESDPRIAFQVVELRDLVEATAFRQAA